MRVFKKETVKKITIDLEGPDGNIFNIFRIYKSITKNVKSREEIDNQIKHFMRLDYTDILIQIDSEFGFCIEYLYSEDNPAFTKLNNYFELTEMEKTLWQRYQK